MQRLRVFYVMLLGLLVPTCMLIANNFVLKSKKKQPSASALREQCCQELVEVIGDFPRILRGMADVQERAIATVADFVSGEKKGRLSSADKKALAAMQESIQKVAAQIKTFDQECATLATVL